MDTDHRRMTENSNGPSISATQRLFLICLATTATVFGAGCSSLNDKADKLMAAQSYEQAEVIYNEMLRKDPHDTDALIGIKKARQGSISSELLIVRRQRLGGNPEQADEQLRQILISLREWKVYPTGAVAFTQNEEIGYAVQDIQDRGYQLIQAQHPLKLAYLLDRYQDFFQEKNLTILKDLRDAANKMGLTNCHAHLVSAPQNLTYYREFLAKECIYWGDSRAEMKNPVQHGLFGRIEISGQIPAVPEALRPRLEIEIQRFLQDSPWFDAPSVKVLHAAYSGAYSFSTARRGIQLTHAYTEEEPYASTELVTKTRSHLVPVTRQEVQPDGHTATITTSQYQDETYTELETITRTRTVTKSFEYPGTEIDQNIQLRSLLNGNFNDTAPEFKLTASSADRNLTTESQTALPAFGLFPRQAKIWEENAWFAQLLGSWSRQNLEQLRDLWVRSYCRGFRSDWNLAQQADQVFACLRERSRTAPPFIDAWLKQNLGVQSIELKSLLF